MGVVLPRNPGCTEPQGKWEEKSSNFELNFFVSDSFVGIIKHGCFFYQVTVHERVVAVTARHVTCMPRTLTLGCPRVRMASARRVGTGRWHISSGITAPLHKAIFGFVGSTHDLCRAPSCLRSMRPPPIRIVLSNNP